MGFIIWYKVVIDVAEPAGGLLSAVGSALGLGLPVTASNDALTLGQIVDAEITLTLLPGPDVSRFELALYDLPQKLADLLVTKQTDGIGQKGSDGFPQPLSAKIYLGYFEDAPAFSSPDPVFDGFVTFVHGDVTEDGKLVTRVKGEERGGWRLRNLLNTRCSQSDQGTYLSFLNLILQGPPDSGVKLADGHGLTSADTLANYAFDEKNALEALRRVVQTPRTKPLTVVLRDNQLFVNQAVGADDAVAAFSADTNLVKLDRSQKTGQDTDAPPQPANQPGQVKAVTRLMATVLGDPSLKVGLRATVEVEDGDFRIEWVQHVFSSNSGFTTQVQLAKAQAGDPFPVDGPPGAQGFTNLMLGAAAKAQKSDIDVGEVKSYVAGAQGKHRATLNYGQSPQSGDSEPAVATPVDTDIQLNGKPIASPFAWHNCGLVVPVYAGMRAVLAHNRGDTNDAVVAGFLWSQIDPNKRPPNHTGDYWLCLPTQISNGLPSGPTANDLITGVDSDNPGVPAGLRVIQAAGLHIQVGGSTLEALGTRPTVDSSVQDQILIEHKSGTTITVDSNGGVTITTKGQKISLSNGSVSLTLDGSSVGVT